MKWNFKGLIGVLMILAILVAFSGCVGEPSNLQHQKTTNPQVAENKDNQIKPYEQSTEMQQSSTGMETDRIPETTETLQYEMEETYTEQLERKDEHPVFVSEIESSEIPISAAELSVDVEELSNDMQKQIVEENITKILTDIDTATAFLQDAQANYNQAEATYESLNKEAEEWKSLAKTYQKTEGKEAEAKNAWNQAEQCLSEMLACEVTMGDYAKEISDRQADLEELSKELEEEQLALESLQDDK